MRIPLLRHLIRTEDEIQTVYDRAAREIKRLTVSPKSRAEARAIIQQADQEAQEIIYNAIRHGAELGEESALRKALEEMKKGWPVA